MKGSHSLFLVLKIKKERENLKKMDETEVYRYKKNPVSEETGQGAASVSAEALKPGRKKRGGSCKKQFSCQDGTLPPR